MAGASGSATFEGLDSAPLGRDTEGRVKDMARKVNLWDASCLQAAARQLRSLRTARARSAVRGNEEHYDYVMDWLAHIDYRSRGRSPE